MGVVEWSSFTPFCAVYIERFQTSLAPSVVFVFDYDVHHHATEVRYSLMKFSGHAAELVSQTSTKFGQIYILALAITLCPIMSRLVTF